MTVARLSSACADTPCPTLGRIPGIAMPGGNSMQPPCEGNSGRAPTTSLTPRMRRALRAAGPSRLAGSAD
eukprot:8287293-Alexandrium_andersonii.AAC.1